MTATSSLGEWLKTERDQRISHGVYYWTSIQLTYNSNHMEGSTLTRRQMQQLYDTGTLTPADDSTPIRADDIIETQNHFRLFDLMLDHYQEPLSHSMVTGMHAVLKARTSQELRPDMWGVGEYKQHPNQIGLFDPVTTTPPNRVRPAMEELFSLMDEFTGTDGQLAHFHAAFERIHPFSDGNGRIGRMLMFKESLRIGALPPVIFDDQKAPYLDALANWTASTPESLSRFMHDSRARYRDEVLNQFDAGNEFIYDFASVTDTADFDAQTQPGQAQQR